MWNWWKAQVRRVSLAAVWSLAGARATWATEPNFKQWTLANFLSICLAFWLDLSGLERAVIIGFGLLILVAELANTAIETVVDYISLDVHPQAKKAKDIGSAAVFISLMLALVTWSSLLWERLVR